MRMAGWLRYLKCCFSLIIDADQEGGKSASKKTRPGHNVWRCMQNKKEKEKKERVDENKCK